MLFPGQGSQFEGMGRLWQQNFATARLCIEEASDILKRDFKHLLCEADEGTLAQTPNTQPALLLMGVLTLRVLQHEHDLKIQAAMGHSVGEYAALVATQALNFADALRAVQHRGQWMQEAVPLGQGGMLAVMGLNNQQVEQLCIWCRTQAHSSTAGQSDSSKHHSTLEPANYNAPGQVVISGHSSAIQNLLQQWSHNKTEVLQALGLDAKQKIRFIPLKVSAPFHCSLMQGVEEKMRPVLEAAKWKPPVAPVVQNSVAQSVQEPKQLCENLIQQISRPVLWAQSLQALSKLGGSPTAEAGPTTEAEPTTASKQAAEANPSPQPLQAIECGPGRVLAGLAKKNLGAQLNVLPTNTLDDMKMFST